jgi:replicative DNA helicase
MAAVIDRVNEQARRGRLGPQLWPTGFDVLDDVLDGGLRGGNLILLAGAQGQGKTTMALQVARNAAIAGRSVLYFCYEHAPDIVLQRLVSLETGELYDNQAPPQEIVRALFENPEATPGGLETRLLANPQIAEAFKYVLKYEHLMHVHASTTKTTTLNVIAAAVDEVIAATGQPPLVVVDYLQKVRIGERGLSEEQQVTHVVEGLKALAVEANIPILAISASDAEGLGTGKRMRAVNLRGSTSLAYECDVMLILTGKFDIVSRTHLVFGAANLEKFKSFAVLTIEKNRNGRAGLDLEFKKKFEHNRFDPSGAVVQEQLIDERLIKE